MGGGGKYQEVLSSLFIFTLDHIKGPRFGYEQNQQGHNIVGMVSGWDGIGVMILTISVCGTYIQVRVGISYTTLFYYPWLTPSYYMHVLCIMCIPPGVNDGYTRYTLVHV